MSSRKEDSAALYAPLALHTQCLVLDLRQLPPFDLITLLVCPNSHAVNLTFTPASPFFVAPLQVCSPARLWSPTCCVAPSSATSVRSLAHLSAARPLPCCSHPSVLRFPPRQPIACRGSTLSLSALSSGASLPWAAPSPGFVRVCHLPLQAAGVSAICSIFHPIHRNSRTVPSVHPELRRAARGTRPRGRRRGELCHNCPNNHRRPVPCQGAHACSGLLLHCVRFSSEIPPK